MAEQQLQRRLAAILAADVVGYSRLMERDEAGTLAALKSRRREVLEPLVARHRGRVFKTSGDGVLVEFASAVHAVQCAIDLQQRMTVANAELPAEHRIVLRVGVNLGDVMVEGSDLYGDGVNIAARLEGIAEPGGVLVSGSAYDQVKNKIDTGFEDLGSRSLKNISEPVRVYRPRLSRQVEAGPALALPDKPSIAVLPFTNLSADAEPAYFADGLTEDLITDLSKVPGLFVIARNSTFAYKGRSTDIRQIARELGVRYVLEGSARRAGGSVRINAQLIDAPAGGHIWADRFDRHLADIFAVQDELVAKIVEALVGKLTVAGLRERYRPASLEAYDLCVRGRAEYLHSLEAGVDAIPLFERAIALDPRYAEAYQWLALMQCMGWLHMNRAMDPFRQLSIASAKKAVELDPEAPGAHWSLAVVLLYERLWAESAKEYEIALRLNPNEADAWDGLSDLKVMEGQGEEAIACSLKALRLSPLSASTYLWCLGQAQYAAGQYEAAIKTLRNEATYRTGSRRFLAAALAQLGRLQEAREEGRLYLARNPHFRITYWAETQPFRDLATRDRFVEGYRKAGLPD